MALCGEKPVSETASYHSVEVPGRAGCSESRADDAKAVARFLSSIGLAYDITVEEHAVMIIVGLDQADVDSYRLVEQHFGDMSAEDVYLSAGRLFGYPETAVQAFAQGEAMPADQQDLIQAQAGIPTGHSYFCFSPDHWRDELLVMKRWYDLLAHYGLS